MLSGPREGWIDLLNYFWHQAEDAVRKALYVHYGVVAIEVYDHVDYKGIAAVMRSQTEYAWLGDIRSQFEYVED